MLAGVYRVGLYKGQPRPALSPVKSRVLSRAVSAEMARACITRLPKWHQSFTSGGG